MPLTPAPGDDGTAGHRPNRRGHPGGPKASQRIKPDAPRLPEVSLVLLAPVLMALRYDHIRAALPWVSDPLAIAAIAVTGLAAVLACVAAVLRKPLLVICLPHAVAALGGGVALWTLAFP